MKYKVEFTCELPYTKQDLTEEWFRVNDELNHTNLEQINDLEVTPIEE